MLHRFAAFAQRRALPALVAIAALTGIGVLVALPAPSHGDGLSALTGVTATVQGTVENLNADVGDTVQKVTAPVQQVVQQATEPVRKAAEPVQQAPSRETASARPQLRHTAGQRAATSEPQTTPPLHGTNPHGEGTVATLDLQPSSDRPYAGDPTGKANGEEVVVGRARGEQQTDGSYRGHITILSAFGNELLGVDTSAGETRHGPLDALQTQLLDQICDASGKQLCLSVLTADSSTTATGSANHFSLAHATIGGAKGLDVGAAESDGNIAGDANCQTATGDSRVLAVMAGGAPLADVAQSKTDSRACADGTQTQSNRSSVIGLAGKGLPLPAQGCADGTPDTVGGIPALLPIVCNAEDLTQAAMPSGVREALDIFALSMGDSSLLRASTAAAESHAVAPGTAPNCPGGTACGPTPNPGPTPPNSKPQCSDGVDNDADGKVDLADSGCSSPTDDSEAGVTGSSAKGHTQCSDGVDNDGDKLIDYPADPGCSSASDDSEADGSGVTSSSGKGHAQCADGADNDGDGKVDMADPGCSSPSDDSELDAAGVLNAGAGTGAGGHDLPFTGTNVLGLVIAGLLALGSGIAVRRRLTA